MKLVGIHIDDGVNGQTPAGDRPGLAAALDSLHSGDMLVVRDLDRLARELTVRQAALALAWGTGATVWEATGDTEIAPDSPDDPMRTFVRHVMGAAAQLEYAMARKRLRDGRRAKKERDAWAGGRVPYGYRAEAKKLVPNKGEQAAVGLARRLRAKGSSLRSIGASLAEAGHSPSRRRCLASDRGCPSA